MRKRALKALAENSDRGSAIVTVVVSMMFILALGAALLYVAYTTYSVALTQRADKANFYDAGAAMDDMRLGVQTLLSEAVATAYTELMADYLAPHGEDYDPQAAFNDAIQAELLKKAPVSDGTAYFSGSGGAISGYSPDALSAFIRTAALGSDAAVTVTGAGTVSQRTADGRLEALILKGLGVKLIRNGYESNITSDITVTLPDFAASAAVSGSASSYAIVADGSLIHRLGEGVGFVDASVTIRGSVFAQTGVSLSGNGYGLTFTEGDLVARGTVLVENFAALSFQSPEGGLPAQELWAQELWLGEGASAFLDGNIHVADDLNLFGRGASAALKQSYFGFGNNTTDAEESSAILVSGRDCKLDLSGLSKLSLAGLSFIDAVGRAPLPPDDVAYNTPIPMGQSLSMVSDQLAYLVPVRCLPNCATNPYVLEAGDTETPVPDMDAPLWGSKTLRDYIGDENEKGKTLTLYKPLGGTARLVYVFLVFSEKQYANEYFRDYFTADPGKISQYLGLYLSLSGRAADARFNTAGNTYYMDGGGTASPEDDRLTLGAAAEAVRADGEQRLYNRLLSPYSTFVNTGKLAALPEGKTLEFADDAGKVVAVVSTAGRYTYSATNTPLLRLILARNDVTLSGAFTGLVLAGGSVVVNADVSGEPVDAALLNASCVDNDGVRYRLGDFLKGGVLSGAEGQDAAWDLDALVYYENWQKS